MAAVVLLTGSGTVELAAYGVADAEATVEKEFKAALPGASLRIREVRRTDPQARIVENFAIRYSVSVPIEVEGSANEETTRRKAYRRGRTALEGSRFAKTVWEKAEIRKV